MFLIDPRTRARIGNNPTVTQIDIAHVAGYIIGRIVDFTAA
jgi:hypothetical protein